ncbi:MAG: stage II sporulation protein P [Clostridia bacterium]|nr:stage II sporulation protein P [Clostridia bacterium]
MKKLVLFLMTIIVGFGINQHTLFASAKTNENYFTVYLDDAKKEVLFVKGDDVSNGDMYLSSDNKLYEISSVDEGNKSAVAKFIKNETLPEFNIKRATSNKTANAAKVKKVGIYHTHNDESYYTPDGTDSVYGKGGIHDVGKALSNNFNKLGIETVYREDLHLPHNSGAYTRSQVTASSILNQGVDGIFDIHRDSTPRKEYVRKIDGEEMSAVRMVVGKSSANFEENKNFAYTVKAYADKIYPGLIKDIYLGKGNYNQQLSTRAMLFEFGSENVEKELATKSTEKLAKVLDVVLYGSKSASEISMSDVASNTSSSVEIEGLVASGNKSASSNETLFVVLGVVGFVAVVFALFMIFSKNARYKVSRFFSEMFAGIFGRKKVNR